MSTDTQQAPMVEQQGDVLDVVVGVSAALATALRQVAVRLRDPNAVSRQDRDRTVERALARDRNRWAARRLTEVGEDPGPNRH